MHKKSVNEIETALTNHYLNSQHELDKEQELSSTIHEIIESERSSDIDINVSDWGPGIGMTPIVSRQRL
jgi:hypothetical protein